MDCNTDLDLPSICDIGGQSEGAEDVAVRIPGDRATSGGAARSGGGRGPGRWWRPLHNVDYLTMDI